MDRRRFRRPAPRGVTLVELMIVAAIIGVMAALGLYGLRLYVRAAGTGEAIAMLQGMRGKQNRYKDGPGQGMYGGCTTVSTEPRLTPAAQILPADFYPRELTELDGNAAAFDDLGSDPLEMCFRELNIKAEGTVRFSFAVMAGPPGTSIATAEPAGLFTQALPAINEITVPAEPWYYMVAAGDRDDDDVFARLRTISLSNEVYVEDDTE